jgi:L-alanine-DL-glutamate epimerase-like enolase superfamily enzyme
MPRSEATQAGGLLQLASAIVQVGRTLHKDVRSRIRCGCGRRLAREYRAASAIDIALWDLFGKFCEQPMESPDRKEGRQGARSPCATVVRGPQSHELSLALPEYARSTSVGVCAGKPLVCAGPIRSCWKRDATRVAMVDVRWAGGLTEGRKIASLAETWHRHFAAHDCIGPVGFTAAMHADFSQQNTLIRESLRDFYTG